MEMLLEPKHGEFITFLCVCAFSQMADRAIVCASVCDKQRHCLLNNNGLNNIPNSNTFTLLLFVHSEYGLVHTFKTANKQILVYL